MCVKNTPQGILAIASWRKKGIWPQMAKASMIQKVLQVGPVQTMPACSNSQAASNTSCDGPDLVTSSHSSSSTSRLSQSPQLLEPAPASFVLFTEDLVTVSGGEEAEAVKRPYSWLSRKPMASQLGSCIYS